MKILIAIPSKGRADKICKDTMRWAPRLGQDVRVFVEPQELKAYRDAFEDGNYQNYTAIPPEALVDIGEDNKGFSYVKGFIKDYAEKNGYELVFKMDDDVRAFTGRGKKKPDDLMILEVAEMIGRCRSTFGRYPDLAAIGFPYAWELWEVKEWTAINARLQTCYIIRTEYLQTGFNTMEDFANYVYIRSLNKMTLRYGKLGMACAKVGVNKGGHQMFDRNAQMKVEAEALRKIYPALKFKKVEGKAWQMEPVLTGPFFGIKKL